MNMKFSICLFIFLFYNFQVFSATYKGKTVLQGTWEGNSIEYVEGQIGIILAEGVSPENIEALLTEIDGTIFSAFDDDGIGFIEIPAEDDLFEVIDFLNESSLIEEASPNAIGYQYQVTPNDPDFDPYQFSLYNYGQNPPGGPVGADIDIRRAWDLVNSTSEIRMVIFDSGIPIQNGQLSHPDLGLNDPDRFILAYNFQDPGTLPIDDGGHGTHVTGIAASITNNTVGISGVSAIGWKTNIKIIVIKVFAANGYISHETFKRAMNYVLPNFNPHIINFSGGWRYKDSKLQAAVIKAHNNNVIQVYPTGNDYANNRVGFPAGYAFWSDDPHNPNGYKSIFSVGSTTFEDNHSEFSNYDNSKIRVGVGAPGGYSPFIPTPNDDNDIYSTWPGYSVAMLPNPPYPQYAHMWGYIYVGSSCKWFGSPGISTISRFVT